MKAAKAFGLILAALFLSWPNSVYAGLTYQFHQTSSSSATLDLHISFTIDNAGGVQASYFADAFPFGPGPDGRAGSLDNLLAFDSNIPGMTVDTFRHLAGCPFDPHDDDPCSKRAFKLDITTSKVSLYYASTNEDIFFGAGDFNSEAGYASYTADLLDTERHCDLPDTSLKYCFFEGEFVRVHVPEPGTLALLGTVMMGFAALRRRDFMQIKRASS